MEYGNDFDFSYGVPDGPTMSSSGSDIFSVIMTVYLLVIVAAVMIGIVKYVFKSIALYRLAQRTGNANPWMAWVPFARSYLQGDLKSDYRSDETFIKKFLSEAQAAAGLMHPNVVNVYDVGQDRGLYYMVMELVEGITLKDYIEKKGKLSAKETISIAIQMVTGIQAAHNCHIIHPLVPHNGSR